MRSGSVSRLLNPVGARRGPRDAESVEEMVGEVKDRTGGRVLDLVTSDEYAAC